jgi:hypothetical protein
MFVDGIGFGGKNPDTNPFTRYSESVFLPLGGLSQNISDLIYIETDAGMGVKGLPQSATGQTALWTGINGPASINRHVNGFPTFTLKKIIQDHSIIKVLNENGLEADLLNSYTPIYFQKYGNNPRMQSASTLVQKASGRPLKTIDDLRDGKGLYMDITHGFLKRLKDNLIEADDPVLRERDPRDVGRKIPYDFSHYKLAVFEYFITDKAGHAKDWGYAKKAIQDLESLVNGFLENMDRNRDSLIITSDHGNMEDLTTDRHTENSVPTILAGKIAKDYKTGDIKSLMDIPRFIYKHLNLESAMESLERSEFQINS